jgi:amino acid transporter
MSTMGEEGRKQQQVTQDIKDLHALGYRQSLRRTIGSFTSFALGFAMVSITCAIFTMFSSPFNLVGGVAIWLFWPVLIGVLTITLVYGHLAARFPLTGYAYQWSARLVNGHFGWFTGWMAMLAFTSGTASMAVAVGQIFGPYVWHNPSLPEKQILGLTMIIFVTILNAIGVRVATWVNNLGAGTELVGTVGLALVMAIGLFFFHHKEGGHILFQVGPVGGGPVTFTAIMLAVLLPVYMLVGWEGPADLAEETRDPRRTAPTAMMRSVIISLVAAFFVFAVFSMAIPHGVANDLGQSESPIIYLYRYHFGAFTADLMVVIVFIAFASAMIANVAVCSRLIYSLSRDKMLPGSQILARVNPRTRTPLYVIALVALVSVIFNYASAGIVMRIVSICVVSYYAVYVLTMAGAIWAKLHGDIPKVPEGSGYRDLGKWFTPVAVVAIVFALFIIAYLSLPKVNQVAGEYTLYGLGIGVLWWAVYLAWKIRKGEAGPPTEALSFPESDADLEIAKESSESA